MSQKSGNCGKCGICLAVCPVYAMLKEEQASPRARVQLIRAFRRRKLTASPLLKELIAKCLMCGSCTAHCPSGVDHYGQFMEMRGQLVAALGDRPEIRGLVYLLAREQRLRLAMGAVRVGQAVVPAVFQKKYRLGNIAVQNYPRLNIKPFRSTVAEEIAPPGRERGTVVYFTGCATNYIFGETGRAALMLLGRLGYRVIVPKKQTCCSIPMLFHGGIDQARDNILANIECLDIPESCAVLVDCPTCGSALRQEFPAMMHRWGLDGEAAAAIADKTRDILSFIAEHEDELLPLLCGVDTERKIAYHLPCHLKNSGDSSEGLLRRVLGKNFVSLADQDQCCGGGGTFFYEYPEVSGKMAAAKIATVRASGAALWLTDCPVCRINLGGQLAGEDGIVMDHPLSFLAGLLGNDQGRLDETVSGNG